LPYSTLVAGTTITASWANANVRDQVVTPFATTAARDSAITSPVNGMLASITDDDTFTVYNGSAWSTAVDYGVWSTWTTTLTQSGSVSHTALYARYMQEGKKVVARCSLDVTGTGTASNSVTISLPVTAASGDFVPIGSGRIYDTSASTQYAGVAINPTTTTCSLLLGSGGVSNFMGATGGGFTAALASGDDVGFAIEYEAA
jgi:hypothetical protein